MYDEDRNSPPCLYLAGAGMISAMAPNLEATYAAVTAGRSGYQFSPYRSGDGEAITMALVPPPIFDDLNYNIEECNPYNACFDHIIKMAIIAIKQACSGKIFNQPIPLLLGMPEQDFGPVIQHDFFTANLEKNCPFAFAPELTRNFYGGRAAGMEAVDFAFRYRTSHSLFMLGASESPIHMDRIKKMDEDNRLSTRKSSDSFVPGEGAVFLLLTSDPHEALNKNNHIIALHSPGIAYEAGNMYSDEPYRGEGLDQAFKKALIGHKERGIQSIFSSMNGENFWAKEYGVAYLRNKSKFTEPLKIEHPADSYGDLGCATTNALIAMAAEHLWKNNQQQKCLVYSSSDKALRGALVIEKLPTAEVGNIKRGI